MRFETPPPERARRLTSRLIRPRVRSILTSPQPFEPIRTVSYHLRSPRHLSSTSAAQRSRPCRTVASKHSHKPTARTTICPVRLGYPLYSLPHIATFRIRSSCDVKSIANFHWLVICECCQAMRVPTLINQNRTGSIRQPHESCPSTLPMPDGCSSCGVA